MVKIKLATREDAEALSRLNKEFNGVSTGADLIQKSLNQNMDEKVVVAELNGELVGFGCIRISQSFCYMSSIAEITEIFVTEDFRRKGVASQLITSLLDIAEKKCDEVYLRTNSGNRAGNDLFNKFFEEINHKVYGKRLIQKDGSIS